jgi:TadE-like protein
MKPRWNKGQSLVELTLLLPFLFLLNVNAADLARLFYFTMAVSHAVRAGTQYGFKNSADSTGMKAAAVAAGSDIGLTNSDVVPDPFRYWRCPTDPTTTRNTNFPIPTNSCDPDRPLRYVRVEATKNFKTLWGGFLWIPSTISVNRVAEMQVQ